LSLEQRCLVFSSEVETRYPGFWGEITDQDVEAAIPLAEEVRR
jgi:hypothetical protein